MSTEQERVRALAERIAARLAEPAPQPAAPTDTPADLSGELAALRAGLGEIRQRLAHIEAHVAQDEAYVHDEQAESAPPPRATPASQPPRAPQPTHWLSGTYVPAAHPSQERFGIDEAVSELVDFFEQEKTCNVEPGGKPCDHCGVCSSRGF